MVSATKCKYLDVPIEQVLIRNTRNLKELNISLHPCMNVICGGNGAGKSSLIESMYLLTTGYGVRSRSPRNMVSFGKEELSVSAKIKIGSVLKIATLQYSLKKGTQLRINDRRVVSLAEASATQASRIFHPDSHLLVSGSSLKRRQYLDWGAFHANRDFIKVWKTYTHCLKQRNFLLATRSSRKDLEMWNQSFEESAHKLDVYRQAYFNKVLKFVSALLEDISPGSELQVKYFPGWDREKDITELLYANYSQELKSGTTSIGPHRAGINITYAGKNAKNFISRGEQRWLTVVLILAQIQQFVKATDKTCLILIDDIASELDAHIYSWLLAKFMALGQQIIFTSIDESAMPVLDGSSFRVFRLENGCLLQA